MVTANICIDFWGSKEGFVHWNKFLRLKESNVELVELRLDLWGLQVVLLLRVGIVLDGNLLVASSAYRDTNLQVGRHLTELFTLRVAHDDPLVHKRVIFAQIK